MNRIRYSGHFLIATGIIHNLIGLIMGWPILVSMHQEAWYASTVLDGQMLFDREAIIWFITSGTFWIAFGLTLKKLLAEGFVPPSSLGWSFIAIGFALVVIMPVSGAYLFVIQGALLVYGCRELAAAKQQITA